MTEKPIEQVLINETLAADEFFLTEKMAKLAKIARRIGVPEPTLEITERFTKMRPRPDNAPLGTPAEIPVPYIRYTITGQAPKLDGDWEVVARVDTTEAGNLVMVNPTVTGFDAEQFRNIGTGCDFCGKQRKRTAIIVVRDKDGTLKKIGRNCTRAFLGYELPEVWQLWNEDLTLPTDRTGTGVQEIDPFLVALVAFAVVKKDGRYFGRDRTGATADKVYVILRNKGEDADELRAKYLPIDDAIKARTEAAFKWITEEVDTTGNNFLTNLRIAILAGRGTTNFFLIVALAIAYEKAMGAAIAATEQADKPEPVAVPFGKDTVTGTVIKVYTKETDYGDRRVMVVRDDRNFEVWGTVPAALAGVKEGERVVFTAALEPADRKGFGFFKRPTKAEFANA